MSDAPLPSTAEKALREALERARTILGNMAKENLPAIAFRWERWPISHEPLRADARNLLPTIDAALASPSTEGWKSIESAPKDGTAIETLGMDGPDVVQWEEYRCCMLGSRAGAYPPGWQNVENKLPVNTPEVWRHLQSPSPGGDRGTQ